MSEPAEDPDLTARRLAHESLAEDDPTGWFERLYSSAQDGEAVVPWDCGTAHQLLTDWIETAQPDGTGKQALVVGAGTGWDAERICDLGYATTAFDISPSAVETAKQLHPDSKVEYLTANLLDPPTEWHHAFDLVLEIYTVQALPIELQAAATKQVGEQVGPGGTLLVIAVVRSDDITDEQLEGPPWPLTRAGIDAFGTDDLRLIQLDRLPSPSNPAYAQVRAEFLRD